MNENKKDNEVVNALSGICWIIVMVVVGIFMYGQFMKMEDNNQKMNKALEEMNQSASEFDAKYGKRGSEWK